MLYEVLKHVKDHGSVNANQIIDILKEFDDLNTANQVKTVTDADRVRYSKQSLEVI